MFTFILWFQMSFTPIAKKNIGITAGIEHTIPPGPWFDGVNRMD